MIYLYAIVKSSSLLLVLPTIWTEGRTGGGTTVKFSIIILAGSENYLLRPSISKCLAVIFENIDLAASGHKDYFVS